MLMWQVGDVVLCGGVLVGAGWDGVGMCLTPTQQAGSRQNLPTIRGRPGDIRQDGWIKTTYNAILMWHTNWLSVKMSQITQLLRGYF